MNKFQTWLTIAVAAAVGVLFVIWHSRIDLLSWIVVAMGVLLIIPGVYNMIISLAGRRQARRIAAGESVSVTKRGVGRNADFSSMLASVCTIGLGVWMLVNPGFFVGLLAYLFAVLLIAYGLYQIYSLAYLNRPYVMPWFFYIVPVALVVTGVVILCTSVRTMNSVVVLVTGIMLIVSAVNRALQCMSQYPLKTRS